MLNFRKVLIIGVLVVVVVFLFYPGAYSLVFWGEVKRIGSERDFFGRKLEIIITNERGEVYSYFPIGRFTRYTIPELEEVEKVVVIKLIEDDFSLVGVKKKGYGLGNFQEFFDSADFNFDALQFALVFTVDEWEDFKELINKVDKEFEIPLH